MCHSNDPLLAWTDEQAHTLDVPTGPRGAMRARTFLSILISDDS